MIEKTLSLAFAAAALTLLASAPPALAADAALQPAAGTWSGKGWVKKEPGAEKDIVRCRVTSSFEAPRLSIDGKCAASGTNFPVKGYVEEAGSGFTGRWYSPTSSAVAPVQGAREGESVRLTFTFPAREDRGPVTGQLEWTRGADEMVLTSFTKNGELSHIAFER